jgi:sporulation protein YlmC with PRC-barrel domain
MPVLRNDSGETFGRLWDLVMVEAEADLTVRLLVIRSTGGATSLVPWEGATLLNERSVQLRATATTDAYRGRGVPVRLRRDLLRRSIADREGGSVGKVRDVRFAVNGDRFLLRDLDISVMAAVARAVGIPFGRGFSHFIPRHDVVPDSAWAGEQPLRLRVSRMDLDHSRG